MKISPHSCAKCGQGVEKAYRWALIIEGERRSVCMSCWMQRMAAFPEERGHALRIMAGAYPHIAQKGKDHA